MNIKQYQHIKTKGLPKLQPPGREQSEDSYDAYLSNYLKFVEATNAMKSAAKADMVKKDSEAKAHRAKALANKVMEYIPPTLSSERAEIAKEKILRGAKRHVALRTAEESLAIKKEKVRAKNRRRKERKILADIENKRKLATSFADIVKKNQLIAVSTVQQEMRDDGVAYVPDGLGWHVVSHSRKTRKEIETATIRKGGMLQHAATPDGKRQLTKGALALHARSSGTPPSNRGPSSVASSTRSTLGQIKADFKKDEKYAKKHGSGR